MGEVMTQTNRIKTIRELMGMEPGVFTVLPQDGSSEPVVAQKTAPAPLSDLPAAKASGKVLPSPPVPGLPAEEQSFQQPSASFHFSPEYIGRSNQPGQVEESLDVLNRSLGRVLSRDVVRYPLIFVLALGFFYVILNFQAVSLQVKSWVSQPGKKETAAIQQVSPEYNQWMKKYYVYANDPKVLLPKSDPDRDGLTNIEEFYLGTNPFQADTLGDGYADGQKVLAGYNPLYPGRLTADQQKIVAEHVDLDDVRSRLALRSYERVAGERSDQLMPIQAFNVDPSKPGQIVIPKIGVDAPVIWNRDFARIQDDLKYGTAHHPDTPYPGERGTASIHGHSSGDLWDGDYKTVFTKLNFLAPGDEVFVTVYDYAGNNRRYRYVVRSAKVYEKKDQEQFTPPEAGYFLNLSTSWPVGTAYKRYVVTTELVGI